MNNKYDIIHDSVSIMDVLGKYAISVCYGNFICCPFHHEKTPSCKIYEKTNSFHCFGCGLSGDVVKFVALMEHINNYDAFKLIDNWFNLGLDKPSTKQQKIEFAKQQKIREEQKQKQLADDNLKQEILIKVAEKIRKCNNWLNNKTQLTDNACTVIKELQRLNFIYDSVAGFQHTDCEYDYTIGSENVFELIKQKVIDI